MPSPTIATVWPTRDLRDSAAFPSRQDAAASTVSGTPERFRHGRHRRWLVSGHGSRRRCGTRACPQPPAALRSDRVRRHDVAPKGPPRALQPRPSSRSGPPTVLRRRSARSAASYCQPRLPRSAAPIHEDAAAVHLRFDPVPARSQMRWSAGKPSSVDFARANDAAAIGCSLPRSADSRDRSVVVSETPVTVRRAPRRPPRVSVPVCRTRPRRSPAVSSAAAAGTGPGLGAPARPDHDRGGCGEAIAHGPPT